MLILQRKSLIKSVLNVLNNIKVVKSISNLNYVQLSDQFDRENESLVQGLLEGIVVYDDFISVEEEQSLLGELEPIFKRMRYEFDHWDDAIHGFREREKLEWNQQNSSIIDRIKEKAFFKGDSLLDRVHVLDLSENGYIKPHIDAVRFCGNTITGLSLLSDCVMRLVHDKNDDLYADFLLKRRSLYIMKNSARYDYKHEILSNENSKFKGRIVKKDRRISIICRNTPN